MSTNKTNPNHNSGNDKRSNRGEENHKDTEDDKDPKGLTVGKGATEDDKRLIGRTEEVKEDPREEKP